MGLFLLSLLSTPLALLAPLPLKIVVDSVIGSEPLPGFLLTLLPGAVLGIVGGLYNFIREATRAAREAQSEDSEG